MGETLDTTLKPIYYRANETAVVNRDGFLKLGVYWHGNQRLNAVL